MDVVVFLVHGQSDSVSDCIDPYVDSFVSHDHRPEIMVIDSTDFPHEWNASKESLSRIYRKHKLKVSFSSRREHARYLNWIDSSAFRYAIDGDSSAGIGAMINMGLLATHGRSAVFIDADTRFEVSSPRASAVAPVIRRFDLIGEMSSGGPSRMGTWGASCTARGGCFYKSKNCNIPPFIPDAGWAQGVPWFLMSRCLPLGLPIDLPWGVKKLTATEALSSSYTPLLDLIHDLVSPGSLVQAADRLTAHLSESEFDDKLVKYVNLLSSWNEVVDRSAILFERGIKFGYKP